MSKNLIFYIFLLSFFSCSENQKMDNITTTIVNGKSAINSINQPKEKELIDILNDSLKNVVELDHFLDSITGQNNIQEISRLNEEWNEQEKCYYYSNSNYKFKLKHVRKLKNGEEFINTLFFDGKHKIDFSKHHILKDNDKDFETEFYGFNNLNSLDNCRIIKVGNRKFLYADVSYWCNGIGCGCKINFIFDLKTHVATFIENYGFPYSKYFISDFDSNGSPDILLVTRNKKQKMINADIEEVGFKVFWYEYQNGKFVKKLDSSQKPFYYHFKGYTKDFHFKNVEHYSIAKYNWKK